MSNDWSRFVGFVRRHSNFFITTHTRPDGDALGCQLGLAAALESLGKSVHCVICSPMPPRYDFLDARKQVVTYAGPEPWGACDAIVVVDTGTFNQLPGIADFIRGSSAAKFVIDHHQTQDDLGGDRLVDTTAEACGRLIYEAVLALGVPLTPAISQLLFAAVATDTGWFRHTNTTPDTFALASELMAHGANPSDLFEKIYETTTPGRLKLRGVALGRLQSTPDGAVAWTEIAVGDFAATGSVPMDTEDLINDPRSLPGCQIALAFIEQRDGQVKVSFRSKAPADVSKLAETFGGGGHARAAGATVPGPLAAARDRVVDAAVRVLS
ncbi:MAG: bifunctional oligoribonuclease/PAP phosphatase NrnA [Gemmataceae bacterium]|nr:bifunctional oligoribonuclease/PAP phosphatase NrnA [Gemmataceae bacterium]